MDEMNSKYAELVKEIVRAQMAIIGPIAVEEANRGHNIKISTDLQKVEIDNEPHDAIKSLVEGYKDLFGEISIEVSKEAVQKFSNITEGLTLPEIIK